MVNLPSQFLALEPPFPGLKLYFVGTRDLAGLKKGKFAIFEFSVSPITYFLLNLPSLYSSPLVSPHPPSSQHALFSYI